MARKKTPKKLDEHIAELEAVIGEVPNCAACGEPIDRDASTCPHCGTPVREAQELQAQATESLSDLEKHLAETSTSPDPAHAPADAPPGGLSLAAEVVAMVKAPTPDLPDPPNDEATPAPVVETELEVQEEPEVVEPESGDLQVFIEEIEAEVGPATPMPAPDAPTAKLATKPTVRAVPRAAPSRGSKRWVVPAAAGAVMYVLSIFSLAVLDRFLVASIMVLASFLVVAGIRSSPIAPARRVGGSGSSIVDDYVCPLCGTGIPAHATICPTCGAIFEE